MSCCPPDSHKYLAADYQTAGKKICNSSGYEYYVSGGSAAGKVAVIIVPDVWGWNSGRTRNIADLFAESGYFAVVPKLLVPPLRGGTDGDGLPPDFDFAIHGAEFGPYLNTHVQWEPTLKPRIAEAISFLKADGATKIAMVGFCWGTWVVAKALIDFEADITVAAGPHPSVQLEQMVFGGDTAALMGQIKTPLLFMPAGNDSDSFRAGGEVFEALKASSPESEVIDFKDMKHGWVPRGDIADPDVERDFNKAIADIYAFFAKFI